MNEKANRTVIDDEGMRYASKTQGSVYTNSQNVRSCFKCGTHRPAAQLKAFRFLGRTEMVCKPSCQSLKEVERGGGLSEDR